MKKSNTANALKIMELNSLNLSNENLRSFSNPMLSLQKDNPS